MIKAVLFDWGNTLMIDFPDQSGPMYTWNRIEAVKNAEECLKQISQKFPCYIATNAKDSTKEDIYKALEKVTIGKFITDIFCYKDIGYEKPTREFYNSVFKKLSLSPNEIVMIGDELEKDFKGAKQNGIWSILFDPYHRHSSIEPRIGDLSEAYEIITGISKNDI